MSTNAEATDPDGESPTTTSVIDGVDDPGFQAIAPATAIDEFLSSASVIVDEAKIHLTEHGLELTAVDPANVGMVDANLDHDAFEHYTAEGGVIGVDLGRLQDVVTFADSDDLVKLALDAATRKLHIEIDGLEYTLTLIDPDQIRSEPDIPELELGGEVTLAGRHIDRGVTAADMVTDHIEFAINTELDAFVMDAAGDSDEVHVEVERSKLDELQASDVRSLFSLDYLKSMVKALPSDGEIRVEVGDAHPTKMHFALSEDAVHVTYMLAPRIQND
jgi:proliferating cell nuclear antigen